MKSRSSNRVRTSDPPDDWVNGSWTVDCVCGVTFDDGEEMVNCDECGVWVHTRCFRFAKGAKSFACDKCKNKGGGNDSEETEVAQLLVELPTKTIKMSTSNHSGCFGGSRNGNGNGNGNSNSNSNVLGYGSHSPAPRRSPYRMWAKPMEERVHVQGVPGGGDDSGLFKGFPIAFASELWKCSGYVPKKFNFRYREFPCWDDEVEVEVEAKGADVGGESGGDRGAGVLCSLSKENVVVSVNGGEARTRSGGGLERKGLKDRKTSSGDLKKTSMVSLLKKEKGVCRSILAKRSREELGSSKDRSGKKKMKASPREEDSKKDRGHDFKTVIVQSISARQAEVCERKAHKVASNAHPADVDTVEKTKTNSATDEGNLVHRSPEVSGRGGSSDKVKPDKPADDAVDCSHKSATTETLPLINMEKDSVASSPPKKEEIFLETMDNSQGLRSECQSSDISKSKTLTKDMDVAAIERIEAGAVKDVDSMVSTTSKTKLDTNVNNPKGDMSSRPHDIDMKLDSDEMKLCTARVSSPCRGSEEFKPNETVAASSREDQDDGKISEAPTGSQLVNDEGITANQCNNKVKCEGSENPVDVQRTSLGSKEATKVAAETPKLSEEKLPSPSSHHNAGSVGKMSLSSSTIADSRSSLSDKNKVGTSQCPSSTSKRMLSNSSTLIKKEISSRVQVKDGYRYEETKGIVKDPSKPSSTMKASHSSKIVTSPVLKHHSSLGKDSMRHPFTKKTSVELSSGNDEPAGSQPTQQGSNGQNKSTSAGQPRGEKTSQSNLMSSKSAQFGQAPPSSIASAGLSDEELALLLHQELNSSPRVPRVPRVRHTGNLPQISSASATSIFIKRSNSSGGKEQQTFSRRKNKDGSQSSRDQESEVRKFDRAPSSPDSVKTSDAEGQAEGPSESIHSARKNAEDISASAHSGPSSTDANELKSSCIRGSSNNNPEDNTGTNKGSARPHRTLPGLIAEIMGEGKRMTYEELCNAVLPHWQNLRKHNGERYAYSSHSQAVLDCLRNRSEWSRLVDRGPKTSASRKKRKIDVDPPNTESEDGGYRTRRGGKSKSFESNKEEFPKGRRKAQKRRRLALQGRGVRDDRKRTKVEVRSEDSASFSGSSENTGTSENDSQESGMCAAKSDVSASSADTATMR